MPQERNDRPQAPARIPPRFLFIAGYMVFILCMTLVLMRCMAPV
jgi:hypothetical protein